MPPCDILFFTMQGDVIRKILLILALMLFIVALAFVIIQNLIVKPDQDDSADVNTSTSGNLDVIKRSDNSVDASAESVAVPAPSADAPGPAPEIQADETVEAEEVSGEHGTQTTFDPVQTDKSN